MLISRWTKLTCSESVREVNLANTLVVSTRQMDENQTNWKSYSIADRAMPQFNQPDELYIARSPPGESIVVRRRSLGGHKTSPGHVSFLLGRACSFYCPQLTEKLGNEFARSGEAFIYRL